MDFNETWQIASIQGPLPSLCILGRSKNQKWPHWPLIDWDIFYFSVTATLNSTKLYRKHDLNVLYQVYVLSFRADQKTKMAAMASNWLRHFSNTDQTWMCWGADKQSHILFSKLLLMNMCNYCCKLLYKIYKQTIRTTVFPQQQFSATSL